MYMMLVCAHQLIQLCLIMLVLLTRLSLNLSCLRQSCELTSLISEFEDIFSENPGKTLLVQHHLKLTPGATPSRSAPYRLSPDKINFVKEEIATLKEQGIVEDAPSDTTWAAPIVVVKKADGGWRLCTDFRKLNSVTEPDPFPLPRIDGLLHKVGKLSTSLSWTWPKVIIRLGVLMNPSL